MIETGKIAAILLAAGRSRRFGAADKLMAEIDGRPMIAYVAERISELAPGRKIAVFNSLSDAPAGMLRDAGFDLVLNPQPERGLSSSLSCGVIEAERGRAEAALVCLADMPFVTADHLRRLLETFDAERRPLIGSARGGIATPPAIFARSHFGRLTGLSGDRGARDLLRGAALVEAGSGILIDIDTPEDLHSDGSAFERNGRS